MLKIYSPTEAKQTILRRDNWLERPLPASVSEGMKRVEYALRRQLGEETNRAIVTGAEEVPQEFRKLVEEYYRSLSKGQGTTPRQR